MKLAFCVRYRAIQYPHSGKWEFYWISRIRIKLMGAGPKTMFQSWILLHHPSNKTKMISFESAAKTIVLFPLNFIHQNQYNRWLHVLNLPKDLKWHQFHWVIQRIFYVPYRAIQHLHTGNVSKIPTKPNDTRIMGAGGIDFRIFSYTNIQCSFRMNLSLNYLSSSFNKKIHEFSYFTC